MLPIKKIYIDSKHRTKDSLSSSHFKYDLPESFLMPDKCGFYVCDVCIPHSWYTIGPGINDRFYLCITTHNIMVGLSNIFWEILLSGRYYFVPEYRQ